MEEDLKVQAHPEEEVKVHLEEDLKAQVHPEEEVKVLSEEEVQATPKNLAKALLDLVEEEGLLSLVGATKIPLPPGEGDLTRADQMAEIREAHLNPEETILAEKVEAPDLEEEIVEVGMEVPVHEEEVDNNREDLVQEMKMLEEKVNSHQIGKRLELQMAGKVFQIFYQNKDNYV